MISFFAHFGIILKHFRQSLVCNNLYNLAGMVEDNRIDPKMVFSYVQEVYRMCNDMWRQVECQPTKSSFPL